MRAGRPLLPGRDCAGQTGLLALVLLQLAVFTFISIHAIEQQHVPEDFQKLAVALPGRYSQVAQFHKHFRQKLRLYKRHILSRKDIFKMATPMFNDYVTFYFQDFSKVTATPIRSGFYSFAADNNPEVLRMKTYNLNNYVSLTEPLGAYNFTIDRDAITSNGGAANQMTTISECDMFWRRLGDDTFVAVTGSICLGSLAPSQVHVGVSMTLTGNTLVQTEGWFELSPGPRLTEHHTSYVLHKLSIADDPEVGHSLTNPPVAQVTADEATEVALTPTSKPLPTNDRNLDSANGLIRKTRGRNTLPRGFFIPPDLHLTRKAILVNFSQVVSALTSGYDVHFRIELPACLTTGQVKVERSRFGGKINTFVLVRHVGPKRARRSFLHFQSQKITAGKEVGREQVSRNVTVRDDGRVKVKSLHSFWGSARTGQGQGFECWLDRDYGGAGGVVFFLKPTRQPRTLREPRPVLTSDLNYRDPDSA